jgi:predicted dehydrogenase
MSQSRRSFLHSSLAATSAAALPFTFPTRSVEASAASFRSPNETPVIGMIGTGIRFRPLATGSQIYSNCAVLCDLDTRQLGKAKAEMQKQKKKNNRNGEIVTTDDYRKVIERDDLDAVVIATPDHWHTKMCIEAMHAGKDVYCEKPLTLTINEGQQIIKAMKDTGKVFQVGTQQRSDFGQRFLKAIAMVRDGRAGDVRFVTVAIGGSRKCEPMPKVDVPSELNWERWQGQVAPTDYIQGPLVHKTGWGAGYPLSRAHRYFRWFYEYSGGKLTDWGAHHVDIGLWAINKLGDDIGPYTVDPLEVEHPVDFDKNGNPTVTDRFNAATKFKVEVAFKDGVKLYIRDRADDLGFDNGIMFTGNYQGNRRRLFVNRGKVTGLAVDELKKKPLAEDAIAKVYGSTPIENKGGDPIGHMNNFFECCKTRKKPISDVESHHKMLCVCHSTNIAMRLGRKLTFDPKTEKFVGDDQANAMLERSQRKGYENVVA